MTFIDPQPRTPIEWVQHLERKLSVQSAEARRYDDYYEGRHKLAFAQEKFREAFGGMFESHWADNFSSLVVDSVAERMQIEGFRFTEDPEADADAQEIWQRNGLDADSDAATTDALVQSKAFITVWGDRDGQPVITPENSHEMVVEYVPGSRRLIRAALKRTLDEWGDVHATLWTPNRAYMTTFAQGRDNWDAPTEVNNPLNRVPVVPLMNRPRLNGKTHSELARTIPIQDAINKVMIDALVASEMGAFPMRWATGLPLEEGEDGKPKPPPFRVALDKMLHSEDPDTKFGQFGVVDLANYVRLIEALIQHMASVSRLPMHMILMQAGQPPSGANIKSAEAGLVAKVRQRQRTYGEAWEDVMRLAFAVRKDERQHAYQAETIWRDAEYRSEAEHIDALVKLHTLGVPKRQLWEDAGYTPQQIERFEALLAQDMLDDQMRSDLGLNGSAERPADAQGDDANTPEESGQSRKAIAEAPGVGIR
ncbi:phage portal protein [Nonomuraea sp. B19D2]|uniref:phage portal protein n=1 Tax=Nonomuraea sp. B19D2 TaxID=3159561 RepID=UPI0032DA25AA